MNSQTERILIFSGGELNPAFLEDIKEDDFLIGADRGALFLLQHGYKPDIALGDFDSITPRQFMQIRKHSKMFISYDPFDKDYTDTELAFNKALERRPKEIVMYGVLGNRFDHSLANIHLLTRALEARIVCRIVDMHNEIQLIDQSVSVHKGRFKNVSLLPLTETVTGIQLEGFEYPLYDATITIGQSLGISNVLVDEVGTITIETGKLLIIQTKD